jgi:hypothetical protein
MVARRKASRLKKRIWKLFLLLSLIITLVGGIYGLSFTYHQLLLAPRVPMTELSHQTFKISQNAQHSQSNCSSISGGLTNNPIADFYGNSVYAWVNQIRWNCVYNIKDFSGNTLIEQFNAARDAAANQGGGVVYFPTGIYEFSESIYLKDGVVLRGDPPAIQNAKDGNYSLPSKLIFPEYKPQFSGDGTPNITAFKKIYTTNPNQDSNIGLVNLEINRAGFYIEADANQGKNQNILVFGIRNNNVADPDPNVPDVSFQQPWMRYSHRFAANIKITGSQNVLVANNRLNDEVTDNYQQAGYQVKPLKGNEIITYSAGTQVPFNYTDHYGIVVNRSKAGGFSSAATPASEPGLFRPRIVIRDNWVYHTMRVGIQASGNGLMIQDNNIRDQPNKQAWSDPTGLKQPQGSVTLENRAIDWSGWNVTLAGNDYQVYRHQVMDTQYFSVDGEGILAQECCGGTLINGAKIVKNQGNSYIGVYKVPSIQNLTIQDNQLLENVTNTELIFVVADTNKSAGVMENVQIFNNRVNGGMQVKASEIRQQNLIQKNQGNNTGSILASCQITVRENTGFQSQHCLKN